MPYDLQTPFGVVPGQVSPYEQLQAQTAARMGARAAADDAASAQMHVLKQAMQQSGGKPGDEPDFSFETGPKDTGAVDLSARNAAVMQRQMGQADKDMDAFRSTGLDAGTRERLAQGAAKGMRGQQEEDDLLHGIIMQQYQKALGVAPKGDGIVSISGGREGAPKVYGDPDMMAPMGGGGGGSANMNPNFTPGGINLGAMGGGGSAPTVGGGGAGGIDYRQLGALAALRNHTAMPDFAGQDEDRAYKKQARALELQKGGLEMDKLRRDIAQGTADEAARRAGKPLVARGYQEVATDPQVLGKLAQLGKIIASNNLMFTDANMADLTGAYQDLTKTLDSMNVSPEARTRILQDAKDQMRKARAGAQGLWHGQGMDKLDSFTG